MKPNGRVVSTIVYTDSEGNTILNGPGLKIQPLANDLLPPLAPGEISKPFFLPPPVLAAGGILQPFVLPRIPPPPLIPVIQPPFLVKPSVVPTTKRTTVSRTTRTAVRTTAAPVTTKATAKATTKATTKVSTRASTRAPSKLNRITSADKPAKFANLNSVAEGQYDSSEVNEGRYVHDGSGAYVRDRSVGAYTEDPSEGVYVHDFIKGGYVHDKSVGAYVADDRGKYKEQ